MPRCLQKDNLCSRKRIAARESNDTPLPRTLAAAVLPIAPRRSSAHLTCVPASR